MGPACRGLKQYTDWNKYSCNLHCLHRFTLESGCVCVKLAIAFPHSVLTYLKRNAWDRISCFCWSWCYWQKQCHRIQQYLERYAATCRKKVKEICFLKRAAFNHNCSWFSPAIPISAVHYVLPDRDYLQSPTQKA